MNNECNFIEQYHINESLCDKFINFFESSDSSLKEDMSFTNRGYTAIFDVLNKVDVNLKEDYEYEISKIINSYKKKYVYSHTLTSKFELHPKVNLQKYMPGDFYSSWHTENVGFPNFSSKRHLVFMTYLNNVGEGGETEFFYQNIKIKPKKGLTLIWPTQWTHTHKGLPCTTEKYVMTGWFSFSGYYVVPSEWIDNIQKINREELQ